MEFVHPEILWGLGALAIPIAIHLLHFRRFKRVRFSQVAFLKDVQRDTRATQQIRHWWVLLMRLLAFTALILAFAQPTWFEGNNPAAANAAGHAVSIYIDNSLSMEGMGEEGQLLQSARNKAALVVEQYEPTDQFQVVTNDFSGRDQAFLTREQALERIESVRVTPRTQALTKVLERIENQLGKAQERRKSAYFFSDLQATTHALPPDAPAPDSTIQWFFVPELAGGSPNVWVDSVWFDEPVRIQDREACLHIRLDHNSRASVDRIPMNLQVNGERVAIGTFNLVPGIPTDTVLRFTHGAAGIQSATVEIEDAPIRFDDRWHFGYDVLDRIEVLVLARTAGDEVTSALRRAFNTADGLYTVTVQSQWSPGDFTGFQVVVLNGWPAQGTGFSNALRAYAAEGGTVVYMPAAEEPSTGLLAPLGVGVASRWDTRTDRVSDLQLDHPFFADMFARTPERIDLPTVSSVWDRPLAPLEEVLATTENGKPFLTRIPVERGQVFVLNAGADLENTNLIRHAFWVPLMLRIAERSSSHAIHQAELGTTDAWTVPLDAEWANNWSMVGPVDAKNDGSNLPNRWMPEMRALGQRLRVNLAGVPFTAGHYLLQNGETSLAAIGLNQDRTESDHAAWSPSEFEAAWNTLDWPAVQLLNGTSSTLPQVIQRMEQGLPLWKALLILALAALAVETLLLRLWTSSSKA
jgi:hypothetical protein